MSGKEKTKRTPQQIGRASKQKGARFELEIAHYFKDHGYPDACRIAQHCGKTGDAGDVEGVPHLHIECKHVEKHLFTNWRWKTNNFLRTCSCCRCIFTQSAGASRG